ncbi:MAG TPA: BatA domain-containing protein, partial [Isosphaeraceae bacterium]|nr:BatA domain-containing protein [Isosphaeraceae bacterium]
MKSASPLPLFWALEFANPGLLAGIAAASIPILIHLLNRRKFREMQWAAMQFLLAAIRKNQRRIRIEQWLLLAIRTLLLLAIVAAMAKPFLESFGNVITGRRTHRVLVLDGSLSMGYSTGGTSRFDQAKALAAQIVKDSRQGDAISVVLMGQPPRVIIGDPSPNLTEVQKEIAELSLPHGATDLAATFDTIDRVLDVSSIPQKEMIFLTDMQKTSWSKPAAPSADGLDRALARLVARRPRSVIIDLGREGSENRAITDLRVEAPVVTAGQAASVRAVIHNFGPSRADAVLVRLTLDDRVSSEQSLELPVGEDVPVLFNQQFSASGDHAL